MARVLSNNKISPAELIFKMTEHNVLRVTFQQVLPASEIQVVDLYIWLCPKTNHCKGLNIVAGKPLRRLAGQPLSKSQTLSKIIELGYEDGQGMVELLSNTGVNDLQRLYSLNRAAA